MKKIIIITLVSLFIISCKTEKPLEDGKCRIKGTITGLTNGEIYVFINSPKVDTIKVVNGKFQFENEIKESVSRIYLTKDANAKGMDPKTGVGLYIEPTIMNLSVDYENFSKSKLAGCKTQDDNYRLDAIRKDIASKYQKEQEIFDAVREKYNKASAANASADELEAIKYEDDEARGKLAPMWEEQSEATLKFIEDNPKSYVSVNSLLFLLGNMKYDKARALYDSFNPLYTNTESGKHLLTEIENMKKGIPGALAGNFDTIDINGNPLRLADFKGQYFLIDFWASWCVPCRKGNPHLLDLYAKYNPKGFEILGVSDDDRNHDAWRKAVDKDKIGVWRHVLRGLKMKNGRPDFNDKSTDISEGYNISSLPTKILVDPEGVIIGRYGGGGEDDAAMDKKLVEIFN
ncbi:TlpA disulfide reductase family protein [Flavivirga sp. 57AJ16]|uniref:TlpA disulfide reductase family protein n=1 Tax=Flavivirga sp. 57AJ16 TaxID=3025307 RepID=UPI002364FD96|nr:TlpA disulfide reductase family protein [Flavivirga sp. 57AJ16]MDD7888014.1 TlpA disulfide reductase family protein [Flavivirga sp. 57AJ16]